jgi:pimeloyl-ACP methyl ester carboxylesterase
MEQRIDHLVVEVSGAENPKFTAPLLLLHGLWCTAAMWRRYAGFLAHRGWACHAVNLRGRHGAPPAQQFADYESDVQQAIAAMIAPPVIVGHDLGALLALRAAGAARAVVALAPRIPQPLGTQPAAGLPLLAVRWRTSVHAPRGAKAHAYFGDLALPLVNEPAAVLRTLMREQMLVAATPTPTLVVAGGRDPFMPSATIVALAQQVGATLSVDAAAGHALPVEVGWERRVGEMHRWLIKSLGDSLLALREESEEE